LAAVEVVTVLSGDPVLSSVMLFVGAGVRAEHGRASA